VLETLRRSAGLKIARYSLRNERDNVMSFSNALTDARKLLVIMPLAQTRMIPTHTIMERIKKRFDEQNVTIVSSDHAVETMRLIPRANFIRILDEEISAFFLPDNAFINRIRERRYDAAIDLSLDLVLPSAYIVKKSEALVRIGFARESAELFYNFLIHSNPNLDPKLIYSRLAECLDMF
jgi:ADP-heptose:LPS heptosyltransferase